MEQHQSFCGKKYPGHGVFRNNTNQKWYGIILNIHASKIMNEDKEIEILDVKIKPEQLEELLNKPGYYPAYHMNKKNWITLVLDETLSDEEIKQHLDESFHLSNCKK